MESIDERRVGPGELRVTAIFDGFNKDGTGVDLNHNHDVVITGLGAVGKFSRLVGEDGNGSTVEEVLIGFTKMHVQAALMAAHKSAVWELDGRAWDRVYNKRFLLQAYPADKIK